MPKIKKSSFYHTRWNRVGINENVTAEILGVSAEQVRRFDIEGAPAYAERLLLLWDKKHVGLAGWQGWYFSRGVLRHGREQWTPQTIINDRRFREELEREASELIKRF